jgi:protein-S-isoprenylcysteine O-methyltransferase Ste14
LEEDALIKVHGAAYLTYAGRVGRLSPWTGRLPTRRASP